VRELREDDLEAGVREESHVMLEGKAALITGAARGIGRATALALAEEGADVGLADILEEIAETAASIVKMGRRAATAVFDISDAAQVHTGVETIRSNLGPIDILVNNAGIVNNIAPLARMSQEAWQRELAVNLSGAFNMIQEMIGSMATRKWGRIINVSSVAALGGSR
jgi:3-oxoacyl-[acyl-carrier protein] reductase